MIIRRILLGWLLCIALAASCARGNDVGQEETSSASGGGGGPGQGGASASGAGGGTANPCEGVTCNTPPPNTCADAGNLTVYAPMGTCAGGQCNYGSSKVPCPNGCANNACTGDPCIGVSCLTPPANTCADATHVTVNESPGACNNGMCVYPSHLEFCANGCANGMCNGDPCIGVMCNAPPANYCSGPNDLTVYDVPGACMAGTCKYMNHTQFCAFGCVNGMCSGDPCLGVTCMSPPAAFCSGPNTVTVFDPVGSCMNGICSYPSMGALCPKGCVNGKCVACAVQADCPAGQWCNNATCVPCGDDQHCGPSCLNCTQTGQFCNAASTACIACVIDSQCGAGQYCNAGTCAACNTPQHCGAGCVACSGTTPACNGSACVCSGGSCGPYNQCTGGVCAECSTDASCGMNCTACAAPTPRCLDQGMTSACVQCLTNADCMAPTVCTNHACVAGCPLPVDACMTGVQDRKGCANARILGRSTAGTPAGYTASPTTFAASNLMDAAGCDDSGNDHSYRIFMRQGESITVSLSTGAECLGASWFATLKFYTNAGCNSTACTTTALCDSGKSTTTKS